MLKPFRGVLYNPQVVGNPQQVVSPPYDLITPELQEELYLRSPYNSVRLDLNRDAERYKSAAQTFTEWLARGVLIQEQEPALYFYRQEFTHPGGGQKVRRGIVAAMRLEEFATGMVQPHEHTLESVRTDRLELLRSCQANFSPIFALYSRSSGPLLPEIEERLDIPPLADVKDSGEVTHRFWRITNQEIIHEFVYGLAQEPVIIADGHHRYETALRYGSERMAQAPASGEEPFRYVLTYLTNMQEEGLMILPTHRLLRDVPFPKPQDLQKALRSNFRLTLFPRDYPQAFFAALKATDGGRRIGCVLAEAQHYWLLSFDERVRRGILLPEPVRSLDVTILHAVIFARYLGLPPAVQKQKLEYTVAEEEALRWVTAGKYQAAFFLNPITVKEIQAVCSAAEMMPEKSTYFSPKLLTGLVFYQLSAAPQYEQRPQK
jgi:uncharacterized protein (DUF1015 family)